MLKSTKLLEDLFHRGKLAAALDFPGGMGTKCAELVLRILTSKEMREADLQYKVNEAYALVCDSSSTLLTAAIPRLLRTERIQDDSLENALDLMEECLQRVPESCARLPLADLRMAITRQGESFNSRKTAGLRSRIILLEEQRSVAERMASRARQGRRAPMQGHTAAEDEALAQSQNDYRAERLLPSAEDLASGRSDPLLRSNLIGAHWPNGKRYLDTHFRLLREDFCASLRMAAGTIRAAAEGRQRPAGRPLQSAERARPFVNVKPRKPVVGRDGAMHIEIEFSLQDGDEIDWSESDALTFGQLLCLTPVRPGELPFERVVFATVAGKDPRKLQSSRGVIEIKFVDRANLNAFSLQSTYLMIEAPCFFGATEPVLKALQRIDPDRVPFADALLEGNGANAIPDYLLRAESLDLSCLYSENGSPLAAGAVHGPIVGGWPHEQREELAPIPDESQLAAIRHMLTHKVAVVQGPPGTGKSFIGVKLVQIIQRALEKVRGSMGDSGPILVICYTNHALDEFLLDLLPHIPKLVRIGGRSRSTDAQLRSRMLFALQEMDYRARGERYDWGTTKRSLEELAGRIADFAETLRDRQSQGVDVHMASLHVQTLLHIFSDAQREDLLKIPGIPAAYEEIRGTSLMDACRIWARGAEERAASSAQAEIARRREAARRAQPQPIAISNAYSALADLGEEEEEEEEDEEEKRREIERNAHVRRLYSEHQRNAGQADWNVVAEASVQAPAPAAVQQADTPAPAAAAAPIAEVEEAGDASVSQVPAAVADVSEHIALIDDERHMDDEEIDLHMEALLEARSRRIAAAARLVRSEAVQEILSANEDAVDNVRLLLADVDSVWKLPPPTRLAIVHAVDEMVRLQAEESLARAMEEYERMAARLQQMKQDQTLRALRSAPLVAMTSTAAATHRDMIARLRPSVLVIEEAAELLEAQVLSCIATSVQHLILIGDHEQLRPKVNCYELEKHYNFHISMFERLLRLGIPKATLLRQARMRPEIAEISRRFYPGLQDHPLVTQHPRVLGVSSNLFFLDHNRKENTDATTKSTKVNAYEADMAVRLADYLVKQGYHANEITLLTPYLAQFRRMRNLARTLNLEDVRIVTIDDYQGDENKIIILSLVRSNVLKRIGFIGIRNRIIVSLSRARHGLFVLGNFSFLAELSPIWKQIVDAAREGEFATDASGPRPCIGAAIKVECQKHPDRTRLVSNPADFAALANGGCTLPCGEQKECGHVCHELCHPGDHSNRRCLQPCRETYETTCKHQCKSMCHHGKPCPPCNEPVERRLDVCGHLMTLSCSYQNGPSEAFCHKPCEMIHEKCGHQCMERCGKRPCGPCKVRVRKSFACAIPEHAKEAFCSSDEPCGVKCTAILDCGHTCPGTCGTCFGKTAHLPCAEPCKKPLLCGHACAKRCSEPCTAACARPCENGCVHRQWCYGRCGDLCTPCREPCGWKCKHFTCRKLCYEKCDRPICNKRCTRRFPCGHKCRGVCGEPCPPCPACEPHHQDSISLMTIGEMEPGDLLYQLECGHVFELQGLDEYMFRPTTSGGHASVKLKDCPACRRPVRRALRYANVVKPLLVHVENIKRKVKEAEARRALELARAEVVAAMRVEVSTTFAGGRWFVCPNGHPYFIGECGGAMQVSRCIDCGARVGGSGHAILQDNAFAGSMDGSERPAWSTMMGRGRV